MNDLDSPATGLFSLSRPIYSYAVRLHYVLLCGALDESSFCKLAFSLIFPNPLSNMEKYSAWRDASTGVLPFVLPVSPDSGSRSTIFLAVLPLQILVVAVRIVLLIFFLALYSLFELIFDVTVRQSTFCAEPSR